MAVSVRAQGHLSHTKTARWTAEVKNWTIAIAHCGIGIGYGTNTAPTTVSSFRAHVNGALLSFVNSGTFQFDGGDVDLTMCASQAALSSAQHGDKWCIYLYDTSDSTSPQPVLAYSNFTTVENV